jgi:hypothetical protein
VKFDATADGRRVRVITPMIDEQNTGWTGRQRAFGDFATAFVHYTGIEHSTHRIIRLRDGRRLAPLQMRF